MKKIPIVHPILKFLASHGLIYGFCCQFSAKPEAGLPLITIAYAINTIIDLSDLAAFLSGVGYLFPSIETDFDSRLDFAVPFLHSFGSLLSLTALLSISNDKMSLMWFGLIGSFIIYVGGLLSVLKVLKLRRINGLHY